MSRKGTHTKFGRRRKIGSKKRRAMKLARMK